MNNLNSPITFKHRDNGYKANKPEDQSGEYVSLEVADELLKACEWARDQFKRLGNEGKYPEFFLEKNGGNGIMKLLDAINLATK